MTFDASKWYSDYYNEEAKNKLPDKRAVKRYEIALKNTPIHQGMNVLDLGCSALALSGLLKQRNITCNYHGIDISDHFSDDSPLEENYQFSKADVTASIPIENGWADRVFCLEILEHTTTPMAVTQTIARVLKDDGRAVISVPNPYYWVTVLSNAFRIPPRVGHISAWTWLEMHTLLDFSGLKIIKTAKTYDTIPYAWKGFKKKKFFLIPALLPWHSCNIQYIVKKKSGTQEAF